MSQVYFVFVFVFARAAPCPARARAPACGRVRQCAVGVLRGMRAPHLRLHARMVCCRTASLGRACAQNGWTVVIWAVKENKPEALMILLEAGAPKDAPDTVRAGSLVCSLARSWV